VCALVRNDIKVVRNDIKVVRNDIGEGGIMELLLAMAGTLVALGCFALGLRLGRREEARPIPASEGARERARLLEEQAAFRQQMEYNAEMAYGLGGDEA
jgi:hypothetical protein